MPDLSPPQAPDRHALLIDQGNSRIKWIDAIWTASTCCWSLDLTTFGEGSAGDLDAALDAGNRLPPEEVLWASVAAEAGREAVGQILAQHTTAPIVRLRSEVEACGIRNGYREPEKLGVDRWLAVLAAARWHGLPVVVMDLGSATTLDAVDAGGQHLGGLILPGPGFMRRALGHGTSLTVDEDPGVAGMRLESGAAQSVTARAIAGGILAAQVGAWLEFMGWFRGRLGPDAPDAITTVVTGGAAGAILGRSAYPLTHDPLLVFKGMLASRYGCDEEG